MAAVPPPTTSAQPPPPRESSQPATPLSWEGEKMFNIYIYDYCFKRGFRKTARELLNEAEIPPEATPPINARQGLLFEWWSVFWVLFQAKSNGGGSEDALLYTQHQQQQQVRGRPIQAAPVAGQPSQPPIQRQNQGAPGAINGMNAGIPGQHQVPPNTTPMNFAIGGAPTPQANGIATPHPPTPGSAPNQPQQLPHGPQPPNFNPTLPPGQRPASMNGPHPSQPPNGQHQPQRPIGAPNNNLPFQSPTMAHSPNVQQGPPNQQAMGAAPMGNFTRPSPLLHGGMIPTNGVQHGMVIPGVPQQPPQGGPNGGPQGPGFNQMLGGRPPSRTTTPQMQPGMMMQSSPSMVNRTLAMGGPQSNAAEFALRNDLSKWPPHQLQQAKSEVGIPPDKDNNALNLNEMKKLLEFSQRRFPKPPTPGGPSNMMHPPPNLQQRPPQQLQQMQQHPQGRSIKRNSTSPGEEPDNIPSGSSPPDRKRLRRSPENASMVPKGATPMPYPQTPQQMSAGPPPGQQQGLPPPGHPQQQPPPNMILRGNIGLQPGQMPPQMTMNGQPNMMMGQQGPQGQQGMGGMQGGQMAPQGQMGPPAGGMAGQMGYNTSRVPLHQVHNSPGVMHGQMNAGSPAGPDPSFNPGGPNPGGPPGPGGPQPFNPGAPGRMLDSKPPQARANVPPPTGQGSMMPPPSPANNAKDAQKDVKAESPRGLGQPPNSQQPHGQPGQIPPPSGPPNQQPGTPGPQGPPQQQQGGNQQTPGPAGLPGMPGMNSSSNQNPNIMGGGGGMGMMGSDSMLFNTAMDFSTVVGEFEFGDVGSNIVDFERDFGQWFNGPNDDLGGGLEMKPIG